MSDIFTGTPAGLTYDHEIVRQAWMAVWVITSGALVVIVGWMGLSLIIGDHLGRAQAGWRELVPRLALGLVAAAASLWWCALVIDVADAVSGYIAAELGVTAGDMLRSTLQTLLTAVAAGSVGMALLLALIYLVYAFFVLYLVVQMVLRLALIDILLALAPIALGLWILPHTAGWGRQWLRLFMTTVFQQAIQLVALALGIGFLNEYAAIGGGDTMQDLAWEAADVARLHLPGDARARDAGPGRDLRRLAAHPLLRHVPARLDGALRALRGAAHGRRRRRGRSRRRGRGRGCLGGCLGRALGGRIIHPLDRQRRPRRRRAPQ